MRITQARIQRFTVFEDTTFDLGAINVIHGENGAGKTHLLKVLYSVLASLKPGRTQGAPDQPTKDWLERELARKLTGVFRPDSIGRLARRKPGRVRADLGLTFDDSDFDLDFAFNTASKARVELKKLPTRWSERDPVYLPTREALSIFPGFVSLYESTQLSFDETWRDLCMLLDTRRRVGAPSKAVKQLLEPIEQALGGTLSLDDKRFYLETASGSMEIDLVAEGVRKLAMVAWLVANERLQSKAALFWDEPEVNLNPRLIRHLPALLFGLAESGVQVFIATHSLFLLRELFIHQEVARPKAPAQYIGLSLGSDGVTVRQGPSLEDSGDIAALDESLAQSQRFLEADR